MARSSAEGSSAGSKIPAAGPLADGIREFTLDDAVQGFGGAAASSGAGEVGRRQRLAEIRDLGGERRDLFGAGEGLAEAVAEAKQVSMEAERRQFVKKFVSEQWILSCKSLRRPLVYHL